ncbi:sugar O-acetyltransferase [bacterium]|nr:sugar O-acetyltransferase [bacterium]
MSELKKMLKGEWYNATDSELLELRGRARGLVEEYNTLSVSDLKSHIKVLKQLFKKSDSKTFIEPPLRCDYGFNVSVGKRFYANYNLVLLDSAEIIIGDNVMIAPNVSIYTVNHPLHHTDRNKFFEQAKPVKIEDNVWIGGNVVILGGVTIGKNSVIGAGSVVTKNIPSNSLAFGNPCKVVRKITSKDRIKLID